MSEAAAKFLISLFNPILATALSSEAVQDATVCTPPTKYTKIKGASLRTHVNIHIDDKIIVINVAIKKLTGWADTVAIKKS